MPSMNGNLAHLLKTLTCKFFCELCNYCKQTRNDFRNTFWQQRFLSLPSGLHLSPLPSLVHQPCFHQRRDRVLRSMSLASLYSNYSDPCASGIWYAPKSRQMRDVVNRSSSQAKQINSDMTTWWNFKISLKIASTFSVSLDSTCYHGVDLTGAFIIKV